VHIPFHNGQGWLKLRWWDSRKTLKPKDSAESNSEDQSFAQMNKWPVQHNPHDLHKVVAGDSFGSIASTMEKS
jgi:hypothetical protein